MSQYRDGKDKTHDKKLEEAKKPLDLDDSSKSSAKVEIKADAFLDARRSRDVYAELVREYDQRLIPRFVRITREESQFPPFWDEDKNEPVELPLHQHNVSSGRYRHTLDQFSLSYNSFFPNHSYADTLIDVEICSLEQQQAPTDPNAPKAVEGHDKSRLIESAFDKLIRFNSWAVKEHTHLVSNVLNYGFGIYYFYEGSGYRYKSLDVRKCRFPIGTSMCPEDWEYFFIYHEMNFHTLVRHYENAREDAKSGWNKKHLGLMLSQILSRNSTISSDENTQEYKIESIDDLREGLNSCNYGKVCNAQVPMVTCYWRNRQGNVESGMFTPGNSSMTDEKYVYQKNLKKPFEEIFSTFRFDQTKTEIRMAEGLGKRLYNLCQAYERNFSRFLDSVQYASTLYIDMDANDLHNKIIQMGSVNVGKIDNILKFPDALNSLIAALSFVDAKIEQMTSTRGLNKTEARGDRKAEELSNTVLQTEGRIHKHKENRFIDEYSEHFKKCMSRILKIATNKGRRKAYPEVDAKFYMYLTERGFTDKDLQLDDTSELHHNLPSDWLLAAKRPSGMGIKPAAFDTIRALTPWLSSMPEQMLQKVMALVVGEAFGDEDKALKLLQGSDVPTASQQADEQIAEMQVNELTNEYSDFDYEVDPNSGVIPELSDTSKFTTYKAYTINDQPTFLNIIFARVDDVKARFSRQEISLPTLHIWLFNLISTAQRHINILNDDKIRGNTAEAQTLRQKFGDEFNELQRIEARAKQAKDQKIKEISQNLQQQELDDPKRVEAQAKLITAQARATEVQAKYSTKQLEVQIEVAKNQRAEQAHVTDQALKVQALQTNRLDSQSLVGRPGVNDQTGSTQ